MLDTPEAIREEINTIRKRLDKIEEALTGSGDMWQRKGALASLTELIAFMESIKGVDFKEIKETILEIKDAKKTYKRGVAVILGISTFLLTVIKYFDNIKQLFH